MLGIASAFRKALFVDLLLLFLVSSCLFSEDTLIKVRVNWETARAELTYSTPIPPTIPPTGVRYTLMKKTLKAVALTLHTALGPIPVFSHHAFGELLVRSDRNKALFNFLKTHGHPETYLDKSQKHFIVHYTFPLFPDFVQFALPATERPLVDIPHEFSGEPGGGPAAYTGVLVMIPSLLPVYSSGRQAHPSPFFFPRLIDRDGHTFYSLDSAPRKTVLKGGFALFTSTYKSPAISHRVGPRPLIVFVDALSEVKDGDFILSDSSARDILQSQSAAKMLRAARIAFYSPVFSQPLVYSRTFKSES